MSIEVNLKTKNLTFTLDLEEYLNDFPSFVDAIYKETATTTPLNVNSDIEVVDTDYFNSFYDIEQFLSIDFPNDNYNFPNSFLAWCHNYGKPFTAYDEFKSVYRGVFAEVEDFAKKFIEHNVSFKGVPSYVMDSIDWFLVWEKELCKTHKAIKVEVDKMNHASIYVYAIFQNSNS